MSIEAEEQLQFPTCGFDCSLCPCFICIKKCCSTFPIGQMCVMDETPNNSMDLAIDKWDDDCDYDEGPGASCLGRMLFGWIFGLCCAYTHFTLGYGSNEILRSCCVVFCCFWLGLWIFSLFFDLAILLLIGPCFLCLILLIRICPSNQDR